MDNKKHTIDRAEFGRLLVRNMAIFFIVLIAVLLGGGHIFPNDIVKKIFESLIPHAFLLVGLTFKKYEKEIEVKTSTDKIWFKFWSECLVYMWISLYVLLLFTVIASWFQ